MLMDKSKIMNVNIHQNNIEKQNNHTKKHIIGINFYYIGSRKKRKCFRIS